MSRAWLERVTEEDLIALAGLRRDELRRLLLGITSYGRRAGKPWYRWSDIVGRLDARQVARTRRREREIRLRPHGSKYWIAGYPELVAQWHPTKNDGVWPDEVRYASRRRLWWKCPKGSDHEWIASANSRTVGSTRGASRCPFCLNRRVSVTNSLARREPAVAAQWHPTKNGKLRPADVVCSARSVHWFKCPKGPDHEWRTILSNRTTKKRVGCPFCSGQRVSVTNSLATRAPGIARDWHPTKNGRLTPRDLGVGSRRRVWWRCSVDRGHVWPAEVRDRTQRTKGCPICAHRRLWSGISVAVLAPKVARQWHPTKNGRVRPEDVIVGSRRKVWWKCPKGPDHVWQAHVCFRTRAVKPVGCPFCAGLRASVTNSLATRHPELARQWHPTLNGDLRPRDVTPGSGRFVWWKCRQGRDHVWRTSVKSRAGSGSRCPFCAGRTWRTTTLRGGPEARRRP